MNLTERITNAKNMVEIESIILTSVSDKYLNLFAETDRKFNRSLESQEDWVKAAWVKYNEDAKRDRLHLFSLIDNRFFRTSKYLQLKERLTVRIPLPKNSLLN